MVLRIFGLQKAFNPSKVIPVDCPAMPHPVLGIREFYALRLPANRSLMLVMWWKLQSCKAEGFHEWRIKEIAEM